MENFINRRTIRRLIFTIRDGREHLLDRDERQMAEEVHKEFNGYLLGPIGWADFSIKWDISPGCAEEAANASIQKKTLKDWGQNIINLWDWKEYLREFVNLYGKNVPPPPCFTRQERLNGSKNNI